MHSGAFVDALFHHHLHRYQVCHRLCIYPFLFELIVVLIVVVFVEVVVVTIIIVVIIINIIDINLVVSVTVNFSFDKDERNERVDIA